MGGRRKYRKSKPNNSFANFKALAIVKAAKEHTDPMLGLEAYKSYSKNNLELKIEFSSIADLDEATKEWAFQLTKTNIQHMYEKSDWGWNEEGKRAELAHKDALYLVVKDINGIPLGFTHFRFEEELDCPVIYCYELQIDAQVQRKGLGKHLMYILLLMAYNLKFSKVMLTVFKDNNAALDFYIKNLNFKVDETSPSRCDDSTACYEILSRKINKALLETF